MINSGLFVVSQLLLPPLRASTTLVSKLIWGKTKISFWRSREQRIKTSLHSSYLHAVESVILKHAATKWGSQHGGEKGKTLLICNCLGPL